MERSDRERTVTTGAGETSETISRGLALFLTGAFLSAALAYPLVAQTKPKAKAAAPAAAPAAQPAVEPEEQKESYLWSGIAKRQQGKYREAVDDLTIYVTGNDRDPDGHWELGYAWALYNDARPTPASKRKALNSFKRCFELSPSYQRVVPPSARPSVVEAVKQGRKEAGVVSDAEARRPADPEGLLRLAESQVDSGDLFEARKNYDEVRSLPPPPPAADRERVRAKLEKSLRERVVTIQGLETSDIRSAQDQSGKLLRFFPDEPAALELYVRLQTRYSKLAMEGIVGQKIYQTFRNSIEGFVMKGQYRDALSDVNRMLFNFPRAEYGEKKYSEIAEKNEMAIDAAAASLKGGRLEEARKKFEEIRRDYPDAGGAQDVISEIDETRRKLETALERETERGNAAGAYAIAKELSAKFPSNVRAQETVKAGLASVAAAARTAAEAGAAGKYKEAIDAGERALTFVPEHAEAKAEIEKARGVLREEKRKLWEALVAVPAGKYVLGSKRYQESRPKNKEATLGAFQIDRYKVSNENYRLFVRGTGAKAPQAWKGVEVEPQRLSFPATGLSAAEAEAFCRWIGKRLPTEQEWEKAARGPSGLDIPYDDAPSRAKKEFSPFHEYPVNRWPDLASPFKVEGMLSNSFEWTSSWYEPYPGSDEAASKGTVVKTLRVLRGGSKSPSRQADGDPLEVTWRERRRPDVQDLDTSFRCGADGGAAAPQLDPEPEKVPAAVKAAVAEPAAATVPGK